MKCEQIQKFILTDYLDQKDAFVQSDQVSEHLQGCDSCKDFLAQAEQLLVRPFENLPCAQAPSEILQNVRKTVQASEEERMAQKIRHKIREVSFLLMKPKPIFILSTAMVFLILIIGGFRFSLLHRQRSANHFLQEQWEYFSNFEDQEAFQEIQVGWMEYFLQDETFL